MVWLQSNETFDKIAVLDPLTGEMEEKSRRYIGDKAPKKYHGFYSQLESIFLALYGLAGQLFLVVNKEIIEIEPDYVIQVSGPHNKRYLKIVSSGKIIKEFKYSLEQIPQPITGDPTPFVEDEDFDIGLFASNISLDPERRAVFVSK